MSAAVAATATIPAAAISAAAISAAMSAMVTVAAISAAVAAIAAGVAGRSPPCSRSTDPPDEQNDAYEEAEEDPAKDVRGRGHGAFYRQPKSLC
jgi:hypothetical protein